MFVISGVTGNTGSVVAQTLIDQGQSVRVIVRNEEKGNPWKEKGAEVAIADIMDIEAMTQALSGADGAYFLLPPDLQNESFLDESIKRAEAILEAAKNSNLKHAVLLSSVGAQLKDKIGPISTVGYMERLFVKAAIPITAIRPGYFLENILGMLPAVLNDGVYPSMVLPLDFKIDMVATRDIGETVVKALLDPPSNPHRVLELKGAEKYSATDIADAFSKTLGRSITAVPVPQESQVEVLKQNGLSEQSAHSMAEMHENINNGHIDFLNDDAMRGKIGLGTFISSLSI